MLGGQCSCCRHGGCDGHRHCGHWHRDNGGGGRGGCHRGWWCSPCGRGRGGHPGSGRCRHCGIGHPSLVDVFFIVALSSPSSSS